MADRLRHILELLPSPRWGVYIGCVCVCMCVPSLNDCRQRAKQTNELLIPFIYNQNRVTPSIYSSYKHV